MLPAQNLKLRAQFNVNSGTHDSQTPEEVHNPLSATDTNRLLLRCLDGYLISPCIPIPDDEVCIRATITFIKQCDQVDTKNRCLMGKLNYRLATLYRRLGNNQEAHEHYQTAALCYEYPKACFKLACFYGDTITKCHFFLISAEKGISAGKERFEKYISCITINSANSKKVARLKFDFAKLVEHDEPYKAFCYFKQAALEQSIWHDASKCLADLMQNPEVTKELTESERNSHLKNAANMDQPYGKAAYLYAKTLLNEQQDHTSFFADLYRFRPYSHRKDKPFKSEILHYFKIAAETRDIDIAIIKADLFPIIHNITPPNLTKEYFEYYLLLSCLSYKQKYLCRELGEEAFNMLEIAFSQLQLGETNAALADSSQEHPHKENVLLAYEMELSQQLGALKEKTHPHHLDESQTISNLIQVFKLYVKLEKFATCLPFDFDLWLNQLNPEVKCAFAIAIKDEFPKKALDILVAMSKTPGAVKLVAYIDLLCSFTEEETKERIDAHVLEDQLCIAANLPKPNAEALFRYGKICFARDTISLNTTIFRTPFLDSYGYFSKAAHLGHKLAHFWCVKIYVEKSHNPRSAEMLGKAYQTGTFTETAYPGFTISVPIDLKQAEYYLAIANHFDQQQANQEEQDLAPQPDDGIAQRLLNWWNKMVPPSDYQSNSHL